MNRVDTRNLSEWPDPHTDQRLLPGHLCREVNSSEMACYRLALRMAMDQFLTEEQRQALHMRFWLGMSMAEIGKNTGVSASAATKRVAAALGVLRERVGFCVKVYTALSRRNGQ